MEYRTVKYNSREEALEAVRKMRQRKKDWEEKTLKEFAELRKMAHTTV